MFFDWMSHKWFFYGISFIFKSVEFKLDIFTEYYDSVGQIIAIFSVHVFINVLWLCIKTKQVWGSSFSCSSVEGPDCVITPAAQCHERLEIWSARHWRLFMMAGVTQPVVMLSRRAESVLWESVPKQAWGGGGGYLVTLTSLLMAQNYRPGWKATTGLKCKMLTGMTRPLSGSISGAAVDTPRLLLDHFPPTPLIFISTRV